MTKDKGQIKKTTTITTKTTLRTMTRDEFIQRAVISMAGKVVDKDGEITESEVDNIANTAADLADAVETFAHWTLG